MKNDKSGILQELKNNIGKIYKNERSAAGSSLEYTLEKVESGSVSLSLLVRKDMTNPVLSMHGGVIATVLDECSGLAFYSSGAETFYATLNLNIDYLRPAPLGSKILAKAEVVRSGETIANIKCHLYNESGELLAQSTTNLANTNIALKSFKAELD